MKNQISAREEFERFYFKDPENAPKNGNYPSIEARNHLKTWNAALEKIRDLIDAERGSLVGNGYDYKSGEEYGMRRALRIIDKAMGRI